MASKKRVEATKVRKVFNNNKLIISIPKDLFV